MGHPLYHKKKHQLNVFYLLKMKRFSDNEREHMSGLYEKRKN